MIAIELTATETASYEHADARISEPARREVRARATALSQASNGATVEIYSDDDVLLDAIVAQ